MKRLPRAFQQIVKKDRRNKTDIAAAAGLDVSLISRLSNRGNEVSAAALGRLSRAFPSQSDRLMLLQAWMLDKAEEAGFDPEQARVALGAEGDLEVPPILRDDLRQLLGAVKDGQAPFVAVIHALAEWSKSPPATEIVAKAKTVRKQKG